MRSIASSPSSSAPKRRRAARLHRGPLKRAPPAAERGDTAAPAELCSFVAPTAAALVAAGRFARRRELERAREHAFVRAAPGRWFRDMTAWRVDSSSKDKQTSSDLIEQRRAAASSPGLTVLRTLSDRRSVRRSTRLGTCVAIALVASLYALLCWLALLSEPPGRAPRSRDVTLELEP